MVPAWVYQSLIQQEEAESILLVLARQSWLDFLYTEVERRQAMYAEAWRMRPEPPPDHETPRCAALRSVIDDIKRGRLG